MTNFYLSIVNKARQLYPKKTKLNKRIFYVDKACKTLLFKARILNVKTMDDKFM